MISYEPYYNPVSPSNIIEDGYFSRFVNIIMRKKNVSYHNLHLDVKLLLRFYYRNILLK